MVIVICNGKVITPSSKKGENTDILIEDGIVKSIGKNLKIPKDAEIIDASGLLVSPGFVDLHCHLRDPGDPEEETIASGTNSAAKGGFTSISCMANTNPPIDSPSMVKYVVSEAKSSGVVNVFPIGAVTVGLEGKKLAQMGRMLGEGAVAFSDDGRPIADSKIMRLALEYAKAFDVKIISHPENLELSVGGQMNEGAMSTILGLRGIPRQAEEIMVERDISLAAEFGSVHITHVSTASSVKLIREAKSKGIPVTADTCPHYFSLTEKEVDGFNTFAKVNPPLRGENDRREIVLGLKDGTIDAIATDHAPHREEKKNVEFGLAAKGMVGFETAFPLALTFLSEEIPLNEIIGKMTINPAKILGIPKGEIKVGVDADIVIVDPNAEYEVDIKSFASKSKNSPFNGMKVKGRIVYTIVGGKIVVRDKKLLF
ncbi:dihydroorotase [candidate division WOR-1 bacterium RIFOXYA2_FULL_36_21]|uniref:Dihydroorotase n=1 Tax=candidate division WOR-1 bacterium RIFOXYB2_FULL_36_35 TaxID=1802578 RepID=A0A1F4S3N3_UNCSA|nr:MAG: dihydroorotase [candidate division WOR-1 bacterium RIFOXYA2_FULL_36_21]OGC15020.1 MAG: dihydroorotase [candidate division WOR-1 bacterium RIFOXYB2_FULL_36_35]OGC18727.1 MAG: dihydroorotase [candidate division WOR-1 bacterium RIFOXYA12_FULL_36_13]